MVSVTPFELVFFDHTNGKTPGTANIFGSMPFANTALVLIKAAIKNVVTAIFIPLLTTTW